jgi:hypothetical protein
MQRHFKLEDGIDQDYADTVVAASARTRVSEMHYDVRVQTVINYYATRLGQRKTKAEARDIDLTHEQYMDEEVDFDIDSLTFYQCIVSYSYM